MPKKTDINKIMIIGSGPIIIGQACEFDYSGTQACKALKSLGYELVLVNSNPATIMTDPEVADVTYIEPLNVERLTEIICKESPDALLPNLGGQSGLNLCSELAALGVLDKYNVKVIGVQIDAIERGEDRIAFKETMNSLGIEMAKSEPAYSIKEAKQIANELGYPVVVRPAYTMGGVGGGIVYDEEELATIVARGLSASMVHQVLIEESVIGWEELELEVIRDAKDQMITVCFIENIDPMGVHTGDSFCAAPMITVPKSVQERLQEAAYKIVRAIGVIGGTNVQFAYNRTQDRFVIIEINPRTSRSSALASKATGMPIAFVSALLAAGLTLDEIPCGKFGNLANYNPCGDYIVIKFARWAFEKFAGVKDSLGTQMKAVGEVMSIGKTYKEALQKAIRSLEIGRYGLGFAKDFNKKTKEELLSMLERPVSDRQFIMYEALRKGATIEELNALTFIGKYFIGQMQELVLLEEEIIKNKDNLSKELLKQAKCDGFSDKYLSIITGKSEEEIRNSRLSNGIKQTWEGIHVSGTEDSAYYFSTYNSESKIKVSDNNKKIIILGGGPNRIGQGIEFDYCCVHAAQALKKLGYESIIINCNPETVSTDYDTSDKLYFEPLTLEDVLSIYENEKPVGVISQFGGQTPLNLAYELEKYGVRVLGTSPYSINLAEDRDQFEAMMKKLNIPMPEAGSAVTVEEALDLAKTIGGYPLMVRPSYVLGGRGMEVVYDDEGLKKYMAAAIGVTPDRPILIDRFLHHATECEADAISDGKTAFVPAVMEHIELAGIHSGDSACVLPPVSIEPSQIQQIMDYTEKIAKELDVCGLINVQYAIEDGKVYVIEANPRASRTVPLVSKVFNMSMVKVATELIICSLEPERKSPLDGLERKKAPYYGVKEAVFPFNMFPEVNPVLGPEMRSTGEVLGLANTFAEAYYKAQEGAKNALPLDGTILISVNDNDKEEMLPIAKKFYKSGFNVLATSGTAKFLEENGIPSKKINKLSEGSPNILDAIENKEISIVINTPSDAKSATDKGYIKKAAIKTQTAYCSTLAAADASIESIIECIKNPSVNVCSLQEYHKLLK